MIWKATMVLKWFKADYSEELEKPCATNMAYWPECGASYWQLKQKWVSNIGEEEWRLIPAEY